MARIALEFEPAESESCTPRINSLVFGKIVSSTFFGAAPTDLLSNLGSRATNAPNPSLSYTATNVLFNYNNRETWTRLTGKCATCRAVATRAIQARACWMRTSRERVAPTTPAGRRARNVVCDDGQLSRCCSTCPCPAEGYSCQPLIHVSVSRTNTVHLSLAVGPTKTTISLAVPLKSAST